MANPDFLVPKLSIQAEIAFPRQPRRSVSIFLSDHAPSHSGYERPSDLLNGDEPFLPTIAANGELLLVNLESVMLVSLEAAHEFDENAIEVETNSLTGAVHFDLEVGLADGSVRTGVVSVILPRAQRRVQNVLNGDERFFALREGATQVCFINKNHVGWVRERRPDE